MTLKELREKRARLITEAQALLPEMHNPKTEEGRASELEVQFDTMMDGVKKIDGQIERIQTLVAAERAAEDTVDPRRPGAEDRAAPGQAETPTPTYDAAFRAMLAARGELGLLSPEQRGLLLEQRAQTTTDSAGGHTVPEGFGTEIINTLAIWGPMLDPSWITLARTADGRSMPFPSVNDTAGGSDVAQSTEGTTYTDDGGVDVTFGEKVLGAHSYNTEWLRVSLELITDSYFNFEEYLGGLLGERLARRANTELTTGDGTGDPNGVVTASTLGKAAAGAAAVTYAELVDLQHSVNAAYRQSPKCGWMFADATLGNIKKLVDGDGRPLWQFSMRDGEPDTILGKPYRVNAAMPAMTTGLKSIVFGDMGKYFVRMVGDPTVAAVNDKDFFPGVGLAGHMRLDGELMDTGAVKHLIQA